MTFMGGLPLLRVAEVSGPVDVGRGSADVQAGDLLVAVVYGDGRSWSGALTQPWRLLARWEAWGRRAPGTDSVDHRSDVDLVVACIVTPAMVGASRWRAMDWLPAPFIDPSQADGAPLLDRVWWFRGEQSVPGLARSEVMVRDPMTVAQVLAEPGLPAGTDIRLTSFARPAAFTPPLRNVNSIDYVFHDYSEGVTASPPSDPYRYSSVTRVFEARTPSGNPAGSQYLVRRWWSEQSEGDYIARPQWVYDGLQGAVRVLAWTIRVAAGAPAPQRPVITTTAGQISRAAEVPFAWTVEPGLGGAQDAYQLRRTRGSTVDHWDHALKSWTSAAATNAATSSATTVDLTGLPLATGFTLEVRSRGAFAGGWSPWSLPVEFMTATPPTTAVAPVSSIGGVVESATVTLVASGVPGSAGALGPTQVQLWREGVLLESVERAAPGPWTPSTILTAGEYVARARGSGGGALWSPWASATFTASPPALAAAATLTATVGADPTSGLPGVVLASSYVLPALPEGVRVRVRTQTADTSGEWVEPGWVTGWMLGRETYELTDHLGETIRYRQRVEADFSGAILTSGWAEVDAPSGALPCAWIWDPSDASTACRLDLVDDPTRSLDLRAEAVSTLGSGDWKVISGVALAQTGETPARPNSPEARDRLAALLTSGRTLVMRLCRERTSDTQRRWAPAELVWIRPTGTVRIERHGSGPRAARQVTWSWVEAPRVSG